MEKHEAMEKEHYCENFHERLGTFLDDLTRQRCRAACRKAFQRRLSAAALGGRAIATRSEGATPSLDQARALGAGQAKASATRSARTCWADVNDLSGSEGSSIMINQRDSDGSSITGANLTNLRSDPSSSSGSPFSEENHQASWSTQSSAAAWGAGSQDDSAEDLPGHGHGAALEEAERDGGEEDSHGRQAMDTESVKARYWNRPIAWGVANPFPQRSGPLRPVPDDRRTSVVIRNVPTSYTREMVAKKLDTEGFAGAYNFLYVPVHFKSEKPFGFVFVNLASPKLVPDLWRKFDGYDKWEESHEEAVQGRAVASTVDWTTSFQGLQALVQHYRNSSVMHEDVPDEHRPTLFFRGMRVTFPPPTEVIQAPWHHRRDKMPKEGAEGLARDAPRRRLRRERHPRM